MTLRVVGAGLGRTGTNSLKLALERLLSGRCYHMSELLQRPGDTESWHAAVRGEPVEWSSLLQGFAATVDWPASAFWRELQDTYPDSIVLLSVRESSAEWWNSMEETIVSTLTSPVQPDDGEWVERRAMILDLMESFTPGWTHREDAIAAYEAHNEDVRRTVAGDRLVEWRPGDGWGPLCDMLGVTAPDEPFPHVNQKADFRRSRGLEPAGP